MSLRFNQFGWLCSCLLICLKDMAGNPIFLSEAQLVIADPCAETQQWHIESATGKGHACREIELIF